MELPAVRKASRAADPFAAVARKYVGRDRAPYWASLALASIVLVIARLLPPSPRGVGTHEQLGLPPCLFLKFTGLPCPSCGLTTSFAHATRLHFYEALTTQPFGLLAFFLTVLLIPLSCYLLYARVPWRRIIQARGANLLVYALLVFYLIGWVYKLAVMS
jgi:hypothetical protein